MAHENLHFTTKDFHHSLFERFSTSPLHTLFLLLKRLKFPQQIVIVKHPEHQLLRPREDVVVVEVGLEVELFDLRILRVEGFAVDPRDVAPLCREPGEEDVLQVEVGQPQPGRVQTLGGLAADDVAGPAHK